MISERISVTTTSFPLYLLSSMENSESDSWDHLARWERESAMRCTCQLVYNVQNVVPRSCLQNLENAQSHPRASLVSFYTWLVLCCLLTNLTIGVFRILNEHIVVFSELGTDDTFLTLGIFCQHISSRIGGNRKKLLIKNFFFDNVMRTANDSHWRRIVHQMYPWMSAKFLDVDIRLCVWDHNAFRGLNFQYVVCLSIICVFYVILIR